MKTIQLIAWILASIAGIIMALGVISILFSKGLFGFNHAVNYFHVANSLLLGAIALFIGTKKCNCDYNEEKK